MFLGQNTLNETGAHEHIINKSLFVLLFFFLPLRILTGQRNAMVTKLHYLLNNFRPLPSILLDSYFLHLLDTCTKKESGQSQSVRYLVL